MEPIVIAAQLGITPSALERFITAGEVPASLAIRLNMTRSSLQDFVDGESAFGVAEKINCTPSAAEKLRSAIGPQGAIGFLIGLTISAPSGDVKHASLCF